MLDEPEARIPESWLDALDGPIAPRGPDDSGRYRDRVELEDGTKVDVALVHRRLAVLDKETGAQPMALGDTRIKGRIAIVFNGFIYNHAELRKELVGAKHHFVSDHSDTEVILHGYRHWGTDVIGELEGMFAFALWDARRGELVLARDRAGQKPLYGASLPTGDGHAFASSPAALDALLDTIDPSAPRRVEGITEWLSRGCACGTPRVRIYECPPATRSRIRHEDNKPIISSRAYWKPPMRSKGAGTLSPKRLDKMIGFSVAQRMEADVPVGCFLSGGVDSSLIAYHAQKIRAAQGKWIETFTIKMPDERYDESGLAQAVAQKIGAKHRSIPVRPNVAEDLVELIRFLGLPFADSSLLPMYWLCKEARNYVTVALSGDGADELFCGYERHLAGRALNSWSWLLRCMPRKMFSERDPKALTTKFVRLVDAARGNGYDDIVSIFPSRDLRALLARADRAKLPGKRRVPDPARDDFERYLPDDILRKTDTASMIVGLEVRAPYLARELIDICLAEPYRSLMVKGRRKGMLRATAALNLPLEVVNRPKMGFAIPVGEWFRNGFGGMKTLLHDQLNSPDPWPDIDVEIDRRFVNKMIDEHDAGKRDHSQRLYSLLVLSIWAVQTRSGGIVRVDPLTPEQQDAVDTLFGDSKPDLRRPLSA